MSDADALFAQPPHEPDAPTPPDYWGVLTYQAGRLLGASDGAAVFMAYVFGVPGIAIFAGQKGWLTGTGFFGGTLICFLVVSAVVFGSVAVAVALHLISYAWWERAARASYQAKMAAYREALAAFEAGAPARAAARRRHHGLILFNGLLKEANAKRMQPVLAAKQAAERRAVLEAQLAEIFRQYRLRNDWDASDATLVPRLQAAFRKWVQEKPPFPPQDMALLATSADAATRALLPAPTASRS